MPEQEGKPDPIYEQHNHLLEFAGKMEDIWWRLKNKHKASDRAWEELPNAKLEEIHAQISDLMEECQKELKEHPSPKNIVVAWRDSLDREGKEIRALIDNRNLDTKAK